MASMDVTRPKLVVILGACGSGKSVLLKHLVKTMFESGNLSWCRVYRKTHRANHEYDWLPDGAVHDIDLEEIHEYQEKLLSAREERGGDKLPMNALIIDDSQGTIRNTYDKRLLAWYSLHRHTSTYIFMCLQFATSIPTALRGMNDYVFVFADKFFTSRRHVFNFIGQWYPKEKEFLAMFDQATKKDHTCLMYTNRAETIEDSYLSFKAPAPEDFSVEFVVI
jgi:energy-coupling factor transporter ATP-binding protein EcfA2